MARKLLRQYLPSADKVRQNRFIARFAPSLTHPKLWHVTRRGVALGVAVGFFFGFMVPIAQIPASAAAAFVFRFHIPTAVLATLISNPFTYAPIYYAAFQLGKALLGVAGFFTLGEPVSAMAQIAAVGAPLILGLFVMGTVSAVCGYFLVHGLWAAWVLRNRRRRLAGARARARQGA